MSEPVKRESFYRRSQRLPVDRPVVVQSRLRLSPGSRRRCGRWFVNSPWPLPGKDRKFAHVETHAEGIALACASIREHAEETERASAGRR